MPVSAVEFAITYFKGLVTEFSAWAGCSPSEDCSSFEDCASAADVGIATRIKAARLTAINTAVSVPKKKW